MTEQQIHARKQRNIQRYWKFIRAVLKTSPAVTRCFNKQSRVIGKLCYDVHHIIPKELGGTDAHWNLVLLTKKQHMLAHNILNRVFGRQNEVINHLDSLASVNTVRQLKVYGKNVSITKWLNTVKNRELASKIRTIIEQNQIGHKQALSLLESLAKVGAFSQVNRG